MQLSLAGLWQLSPLTDLSIPQDDITFPAPLSKVLPDSITEQEIAAQEWHLMHDVEMDEEMMRAQAIDLVLEGIDFHAEVRVNGIAVFDCDGTQAIYRKDVKPYLDKGGNRIEILFLEEEEPLLFEEDITDFARSEPIKHYDTRIGIWRAPYLQFINNTRLDNVTTEQVWHYSGGCELLVHVYFTNLHPELVSASVKFDGMTYQVPLDVRSHEASVLFQVEAPKAFNPQDPQQEDMYQVEVDLDGQSDSQWIGLHHSLSQALF
ncbi:glycosyl hydrolase 2 galactose-binding domain-containing protein [Vibrio nitrifigilis]|uniref:Beta-mannosidase-like galactose-binding domain-containing protein n=1 Tax=Vibrio nitrifigilis TaxID=2789781 RepID=A0ABS0GG15_9VIBR|nr:hypothetical protein [Vibrio nitrifigilis]MBF9001371.1 hypothetical protein [Vibrio nitrifigilis]